jgi:hypothetical protein
VIDGTADLHFDANYWFNGYKPLPASGCTSLPEGSHSVASTTVASAHPELRGNVNAFNIAGLAGSLSGYLKPRSGSPLLAKGIANSNLARLDYRGRSRPTPPTIGAIEGETDIDHTSTSLTFNALSSDYAVVNSSSGFYLRDPRNLTTGLDFIKRLYFNDGAIAIDIDGVAAQAYRIYRAAFNRTPDAAGLGFWIKVMDDKTPLVKVAADFLNSGEFTTLYGKNPSDAEFVTRLYSNVLHRAPEGEGYQFWLDVLGRLGGSRAQVLADFSESAENKSQVSASINNGIRFTPFP